VKAFIDPTKEIKMMVSKKKLLFNDHDQIKVTAMCYSIMKDYPEDNSEGRKSNLET